MQCLETGTGSQKDAPLQVSSCKTVFLERAKVRFRNVFHFKRATMNPIVKSKSHPYPEKNKMLRPPPKNAWLSYCALHEDFLKQFSESRALD